MQNMFQKINVAALTRSMEVVVGQQNAETILALYKELDAAMFAGFEMGVAATQAVASAEGDEAYDEGYVDGVGDARARPEMADATLREIVEDQESHALAAAAAMMDTTYDFGLVRDSGDENLKDEY